MGLKPRVNLDPDRWSPLGNAGGLRVEHNVLGAIRLVVPETEASWVILPWEVAPLAALLAAATQ